MSEFGLKIKNIEAATLYEYNKGLRDHYDYKDAMFVNSLFKSYLEKIGMTNWRGESTKDIICIEFNFGTRSFEEEVVHLRKLAASAKAEYRKVKNSGNKALRTKYRNKRKKISDLFLFVYQHKEKYLKISADDIRKEFYNKGVEIEYITKKLNGEVIKREVIHYKMLYRSTGKAKKGSCMFIRDRLYKRALRYLRMDIKMPKKNAKIVELSAYSSLIASGIEGTVKINPENILILKDVDVTFKRGVMSVETNEKKECLARFIDDYELKNTLFDGQALIDSSIFPDNCSGYILLREHFCKMAAFSTNIQKFFKDFFGDEYDNAKIVDMFGIEHYAKDIEVITTDNAMKWIKFDVPYEYWCRWVGINDNEFGIVKTSHPSKLGDVQKMSYQMVNSLDENIMESVCKETIDYINKLKTDDDFFLEYLRKNENFSNDFDVLIDLVEYNPDFIQSSYFRERRRKIIMTYVLQFKSGKILQKADNLTIVGSPYAMLLYGASGDKEIVYKDDTLVYEDGSIQCYTTKFEDGEYLAEFRSPFNGKYNMGYLHNQYDERFKKYFNFSDQIIAVNMIHTDFQDRNNGLINGSVQRKLCS